VKSSLKRKSKTWHFITACIVAVSVVSFLFSHRSEAMVSPYTITDLGTLGGAANQSHGYGINNCGTTVGDSLPASGPTFLHPFYKKGGTMTDIGTLAGAGTGYSINSFGYVVGYSTAPNGQRGILWHDDDDDGVNDPGELQDFLPTGAIGVAYDINDSNRVVGLVDTSGGSSLSDSAFVWDATNGMQIMAGASGISPTRAQGINNAGTIAGWAAVSVPPYAPVHAFVLKNNTYIDLGTLDNTTPTLMSFGWRISEDGHVVGYGETPSNNASKPIHPFVWFDANNNNTSDAGEMKDLGTLSGTSAFAYDINASNYVVGTSDVTGGGSHAYVWHDDDGNGVSDPGEMKDLNGQFSDPNGDWTTLVEARSINDGGQIVGWGTRSNGETHAYLLTPTGYTPPACPGASPSPSPTPTPATTSIISLQGTGPGGFPAVYGSSGELRALMYSNDQPVINKTISFTLFGNAVGSATTDGSGSAILPVSLAGVNAGTYPNGTITANFAGDSNYAATSQTAPLTVSPASQSITVDTHAPANAAYNAQFTVAAHASSGLAVTYSSSGACTNSGATFTMSSGTGTCNVMFNQAGNSNYNAAGQITEMVTAQKANQTITVNTHAPANATYNTGFTVAATASSGNTVTYTSSGGCSNTLGSFTMTSGTTACTVKYDQAGDANYNAASQLTESVTAQKANQTLTVNTHAPTNATYNSQFTVAATSSAGLAISYSNAGGCSNSGATFTMTSGTTACTVKYDAAGDANYNAASQVTESVTAQKADQTLTVNTHAPVNATFNSQFTVAATASSSLAISYSNAGVCTNSGATYTMTSGTGTCTVKYDQAGDANFNAASQVTENVGAQKASATITLSNLTQVFDGSPKFVTASTTPAGLTVNITYSQNGNPVSSPTSLGAYAISAVISDSNYQGNTTGTLNIVEPAPVILLETLTNNAAAVDSVTYVRGPFRVTDDHNFSGDHITRIIVFTAPLANPDSTLKVFASGHELQVESFGSVTGTPGLSASYIVFKLDPILTGSGAINYDLTVSLRGVTSNTATLTIIP
jgi:probable HAF family extracellular repeat protein